MFCVKCGTRLADEAVFCFNCGNRVGAAEPVVEPVAEPAPVFVPVEEPVAEPTPVYVPVEEPAAEPTPVYVPVEEPVAEPEPVFVPIEEPVTEPAPAFTPVEEPVVEPVEIPVEELVFEPAPAVSLAKKDVAVEAAPAVAPHQPMYQNNGMPQQPMYQNSGMPQQPMYQNSGMTQQPMYQNNGMSQQPMYQNGGMPQQAMYQNNGMPQQELYNVPETPKKKSDASVPGMFLLVLALLSSVGISIGYFMDGVTGMGIANIVYFATTIGLMVFCVSSKKIGSILKGIFLLAVLGVNIAFAGVSAFTEAFNIIGAAKSGIDYYYAIVLILQYAFLYVYLLISIIRSFMGKVKPAYFACLCGYFAILLTIAAFVIDVVSDTPSIFVFSFLPVDIGIVTLLGGDILATLRKGKKVEE